MTDLFRGYDLTTVVDKVAEASWTRLCDEARQRGFEKEVPTWDSLDPVQKHNYKGTLIPLVTDVLEALESDQVKPTEAKQMVEYTYNSKDCQPDDPRFYENRPEMHDLATCTVWALHMHVHPSMLDAMLERASVVTETTGEYTYGDSWIEWGEQTDDDDNRHLVIYFDATPARAKEVGDHIARGLSIAAARGAGANLIPFELSNYDTSTSGDYAEIIKG